MSYNFEEYKKDSLARPKDLAFSNWAKFESVGDKVQGYVRDAFWRRAEGIYKEQRGITLEQKDGVLINVAVKMLDFILPYTDKVHIGDPLTVELIELRENSKGNPTKIFSYYSPLLSENASNPTVKQLTDEDKAVGGTVAPVAPVPTDDELDKTAKDLSNSVPFP